MRFLSPLLLVLALSACATYTSSVRLEKFDIVARAYERALRWSDFQTAFVVAGDTQAPAPDFQRLQNVRVTSYEIIGAPLMSEDSSQLAQLADIRYVNSKNMVEQRMLDRQIWAYSSSDERWKLRSAFPSFP